MYLIMFNPYNKALFEKISDVFTSDIQKYLNDFDFAATGRMNMINPIFEFAYYMDTSDYEFVNIDDMFLEKYFKLQSSVRDFVQVFSKYTVPTGHEMFHVAPSNEWIGENAKRFRTEADEINKAAEDLHSKIREFIREGIRRISMENRNATTNAINVYGGSVNASIGDGNVLTNNIQNEYQERLNTLIREISESSLSDKHVIVDQINNAKNDENREGVLKILGGLLSRGNEAAGFAASIGTILSM